MQAAGIVIVTMSETFGGMCCRRALLGIGTAMVYPTLLAAIGDVAHPDLACVLAWCLSFLARSGIRCRRARRGRGGRCLWPVDRDADCGSFDISFRLGCRRAHVRNATARASIAHPFRRRGAIDGTRGASLRRAVVPLTIAGLLCWRDVAASVDVDVFEGWPSANTIAAKVTRPQNTACLNAPLFRAGGQPVSTQVAGATLLESRRNPLLSADSSFATVVALRPVLRPSAVPN